MMTTGDAIVWIGLIFLAFAAIAGVEEGIEWWAQRRKARVRRQRQRAAARARAHREAFALDYDWQTWAGEEGNRRPTPAL
jgi:hypothetical protein